MRLNALGQACHGLLTLNIDGVSVSPEVRSTAPAWLTTSSVIAQVERTTNRWGLSMFDVSRHVWNVIDAEPANVVAASEQGTWAAWNGRGIRSNVHPRLDGAGLWGVGHEGTLGYCRSQSDGTGVVFRAQDGRELDVWGARPLRDVHVVAYGIAAAVARSRLLVTGVPEAVTVDEDIFEPRLVELRRGGEWWIVYHTHDRLLLHPLTSPVGYEVAARGALTFYPDVTELDSGRLRVVWSATQGEGAAAFRYRDIDLTSARIPLGGGSEPPPQQPRPRITITAYEPRQGPAPLKVHAICTLSGGPADRVKWRQRLVGESRWTVVADNPATDTDHTYKFTLAGSYDIGADVVGPGGSDGTVTPRRVEVSVSDDPNPAPNGGDTIPKLTHEQVKQALDDVDAAYQELLFRMPDRDGQAAYVRDLLNGDMTNATMRVNIMRSQEYKDKHPPVPPPVPVPILRVDKRIFRDTTKNDAPWRWKGVSAFQLMDRYLHGEDIKPFLDAYAGYNILRVWPYVDWTTNGWGYPNPPTADQIRKFLDYTQNLGWLVELTLLTSDEGKMLEWAKGILPQIAADPKPGNVLIEIGNEPTTHKTINTEALKPACEASGFLYASGNYEQNAKAFGRFGVAHTPRDSEWPRKGHDLMEYYDGGGPHNPSDPARPYPWCGDEPAKTQDVQPPKAPLTKADDWRAYGGVCALLGCGCTFHSETGKYAKLPTDEERTLAKAMLEGLDAFPADAPNLAYKRITENSLRTYVKGDKYMVRVRPTTSNPPESGWTPVGPSWILYRK